MEPPSDASAKAEFTQSSLEYWLMIEYKNLVPAHRRPSGVYVMPSFDNMLVWYGVIFVHHGYYRKGVFRFRIELPRHYPNVRPEVFFLGPVHHPYVRANGYLDLSLPFSQWIPKQHFIIHVLQFMKKMFYKIDVLVIDDPQHAPNPEALELYRDSTIRFWHAAQKCVTDCAARDYTHPPDCSWVPQRVRGVIGAIDCQDSVHKVREQRRRQQANARTNPGAARGHSGGSRGVCAQAPGAPAWVPNMVCW